MIYCDKQHTILRIFYLRKCKKLRLRQADTYGTKLCLFRIELEKSNESIYSKHSQIWEIIKETIQFQN